MAENPKKNGIPKPDLGPKKRFSPLFLILMVVLTGLLAFQWFGGKVANEIIESPSVLLTDLENKEAYEVNVIVGAEMSTITWKTGKTKEEKIKATQIPSATISEYFTKEEINNLGDNFSYKNEPASSGEMLNVIFTILMFGGTIFIIVLFLRGMKNNGAGQAMNFGKSRAKKFSDGEVTVKFEDVAGQEEAKQELAEVVDFLKNPDRYHEIGAKIPRGVLLVGMPGTGKTLLARAVAGEAEVSFFHMSGSDFVEMFVGVGASRVRDLFEQGRKSSPCIIFIDELDAVGRTRGAGYGGGHDEREQTLNQMLVEMDGFSPADNVIILAATNRPDVLDPALLRPGRFDRQVVVDMPDVKEREAILGVHIKKIKVSKEVDLERIAKATPGSSGAELANLVNEAALFAARRKVKKVTMSDFEEARDKMIMGVARNSRMVNEDEKLATAYHEAGHALLHYYLKNVDPLHKVTVIPRGRAAGVTFSLPEKEIHFQNKSQLMDRIKLCMGGYVAEQLIYGETTTGTSNDIKQATDIARKMVRQFGMSDLGFLAFGNDDEPIFLGKEFGHTKEYSEETSKRIDEEVKKIIDICMEDTVKLLKKHKKEMDLLAKELILKETLDDNEVRVLLGMPILEKANAIIDKNTKALPPTTEEVAKAYGLEAPAQANENRDEKKSKSTDESADETANGSNDESTQSLADSPSNSEKENQ